MSGEEPRAKRSRSETEISVPWVEKYRPRRLDEVQSQEEAIGALRSCLQGGVAMPHFLFYGPPGTGKTTSILAVAHELFGPDYIRSRVRELNASDDRGISVVREKVKVFAQGAVGNVAPGTVQSDGNAYPVPPFKLIILDEADALLPDAQAALRRMMEDFSDVTRFCILCNYVSRIIDPIASRCAKYRFRPLVKEALYDRIRFVAQSERIMLSHASLQALDIASGGDMRRAIMHLQSAQSAHGQDLSNEDFVVVSGAVPGHIMEAYLKALLSRSVDQVVTHTKGLVAGGFSAGQVLTQLHAFLVSSNCILTSTQRGKLALKMCETERRLSDGGDDYIQLLDLGCAVCSC